MRPRVTKASVTLLTISVPLSYPFFTHGDAVHHPSGLHHFSKSFSFASTRTSCIGFVPSLIPTTTSPNNFVQQRHEHKTYSLAPYDYSPTSLSLFPESIKKYKPSDFTTSSWPYTYQDFKRIDEENDTNFYIKPRFVKHVDEWATLSLERFYYQQLLGLVKDEGKLNVLDLCSSWISHLPLNLKNNNNEDDSTELSYKKVIGLGMNAEELEANEILTSYYIQNLNTCPTMPLFHDDSFDVVLCSLSVDYLIQPQVVFTEIARLLRSGGICLITFSNRYFPRKAVQMWLNADDGDDGARDRMDIVASYFYYSTTHVDENNRNEEWKSIETFDLQLPRTKDTIYEFITKADLFKWFATAIFRGSWRIDPIYAVKAVKK